MPQARLLIDLPINGFFQEPAPAIFSSGGSSGPEMVSRVELSEQGAEIMGNLQRPGCRWHLTKQHLAARSEKDAPERLLMICLGRFDSIEEAEASAIALGVRGAARLDWGVSEDGHYWVERREI